MIGPQQKEGQNTDPPEGGHHGEGADIARRRREILTLLWPVYLKRWEDREVGQAGRAGMLRHASSIS